MENESGALSRVSGLFSARGYNIESLSVAPTQDQSLSRMTIVTSGSDEVIEQIIKQLNNDTLAQIISLRKDCEYPAPRLSVGASALHTLTFFSGL